MAPAAFEQVLSVLENVKADGAGFHKCIRRLCESTEALKKLLSGKIPGDDNTFTNARLEGLAKELVMPETLHMIVCSTNVVFGFKKFNRSVPAGALLEIAPEFIVTLDKLRFLHVPLIDVLLKGEKRRPLTKMELMGLASRTGKTTIARDNDTFETFAR